MDKRDIDEANAIINFREREMGWKDWAIMLGVGALVYFVVSILRS